jgi:hypothetical protein
MTDTAKVLICGRSQAARSPKTRWLDATETTVGRPGDAPIAQSVRPTRARLPNSPDADLADHPDDRSPHRAQPARDDRAAHEPLRWRDRASAPPPLIPALRDGGRSAAAKSMGSRTDAPAVSMPVWEERSRGAPQGPLGGPEPRRGRRLAGGRAAARRLRRERAP